MYIAAYTLHMWRCMVSELESDCLYVNFKTDCMHVLKQHNLYINNLYNLIISFEILIHYYIKFPSKQ